MMLRTVAILFLAIFFLSGPVSAEEGIGLPRASIERLSKSAHAALPRAKISDGSLIGEIRARQLDYPLLPYKVREQIIVRGYVTGFAEACGLDWENKSYLPFMNKMRDEHRDWTTFQFAYVGLLHGLSQKNGKEWAVNNKPGCPDSFSAGFKKFLLN